MQRTNTNCYENLLGLSCVENNVLLYLKEKGNDISWLYADSEISLKDLFHCFFYENQKYEYFNGFPRIQNKLRKLGIIEIEVFNDELYEGPDKDRNVMNLIRVNPEFFEMICKPEPWRDDHYMLIQERGGHFILQNDSPHYVAMLEGRNLESLYDGQHMKIRQLRDITIDDKRLLRRQHQRADVTNTWQELCIPGMENMKDPFLKIRDLIGIYRISRKRIQIFENGGVVLEDNFMKTVFNEIDKLFTFTAYLSLKNKSSQKELLHVVKSLWEIEKRIGEGEEHVENNKATNFK